jgi:hypothetical protein
MHPGNIVYIKRRKICPLLVKVLKFLTTNETAFTVWLQRGEETVSQFPSYTFEPGNPNGGAL